MSNWFVGLPVPAADWFAPLVAGAPSCVRLFHPDDVHITVAFLGRAGEERALRAWEVVRDLRCEPIEVTLAELKGFGSSRRPSALSVTIAEGHDEVAALIARLRGPMIEAAGARPDDRPPLPHLTIARPSRGATPAVRKEAVRWAESKGAVNARVVLDSIALFTWSEDRKERQFRAFRKRALRAG